MDEFTVHLDKIKINSEELLNYANQIKGFRDDVESIKVKIRWKIGFQEDILNRLGKIISVMDSIDSNMKLMGNWLNTACSMYGETERKILETSVADFINTIKNSDGTTDYIMDSVVFDESGGYGGDQGEIAYKIIKPSEEWDSLVDIIRDTYPAIKDPEETIALVNKLNNEGCGYVAVVNTIFAAYEGREGEFERDFGMPMYRNGDLNYKELLLDFYCKTDNHKAGFFGFGKDKVNKNEDFDGEGWWGTTIGYDSKKDETGSGTTPDQREYRLNLYLKEKGADLDVEVKHNVKVAPDVESFREISKDSYIVVSDQNVPLTRPDGSKVNFSGDHAMVVTGVTSDGRYIVSSWGEQYYIDPKDLNNDNSGLERSLTFETYQYKH